MNNLGVQSIENINTGGTSLDHRGTAAFGRKKENRRDERNTNAACHVLNQFSYKLRRRLRGVIRFYGLIITEDIHRMVFLVSSESKGPRRATWQTTSPFVILWNKVAPEGFPRTCAYLYHDRVAHILTARGPVGRGARVHGETVLNPLGQDRKGMLVLSTIWKLDWRKLQWMASDHERIAIEGAILVMTKAIPEGPSPCIYLEAIDRTLYRNASRRRTGITERLLDETDRVSRLVLLDLLYAHLHMVEDEKIFRQCFRHIFEAHYRVYEVTGILHRDISTDNLMVRVGHDGSKQDVLIDWDLVNRVTDEQDLTGSRTGTRAFMAYDLFDPIGPSYILRFDWETFLYYLVWVVFVMIDEGYKNIETKKIENETRKKPDKLDSSIARWPRLNNEELRSAKALATTKKGKYMYLRSVYKFRSMFSIWIDAIWEIFVQGNDAQLDGDPKFNYETLGNRLTYTELQDILDRKPN